MEEQRITTRRRTESSSSFLPLDVVSLILSKLPAKSVVRFRSVSRQWSSISTDAYFISSFQSCPRLLFFFQKRRTGTYFVFSISQHNPSRSEFYSYSFSQPIDCYEDTFPNGTCSTIRTESVHGLICFQKLAVPLIWNPSLRSFLLLSKPDKNWNRIKTLLGYDPIEGKHKVLCLPHETDGNECRVLTVGSDINAWRTVRTNVTHRYHGNNIGVHMQCINGVLYYLANGEPSKLVIIMRFDVRSEKLDMIQTPSRADKKMFLDMKMVQYEGKLAFVDSDMDSIRICVLEDAEKGQWRNHSFLPLSHYEHGFDTFKLVGISVEGEVIYVPKTVFKSFHVLYVDPKRTRLRRVAYSGILDTDFRQRTDFGDRPRRGLQFFLNHVETLM